jgi:hypothetical protein
LEHLFRFQIPDHNIPMFSYSAVYVLLLTGTETREMFRKNWLIPRKWFDISMHRSTLFLPPSTGLRISEFDLR